MVRSRVFSGRLSDNAKTKANLLPRALAAGTAFAAFLTSQTQEGRWIAVFAMVGRGRGGLGARSSRDTLSFTHLYV